MAVWIRPRTITRRYLLVRKKTYYTLCNLLLESMGSRNRGHNPPRNRTCHCRTRARARRRMARNRIPYRLHRHPMPHRRSHTPAVAWALWMPRATRTSTSDTTRQKRRMFGVRSENRLETSNTIADTTNLAFNSISDVSAGEVFLIGCFPPNIASQKTNDSLKNIANLLLLNAAMENNTEIILEMLSDGAEVK